MKFENSYFSITCSRFTPSLTSLWSPVRSAAHGAELVAAQERRPLTSAAKGPSPAGLQRRKKCIFELKIACVQTYCFAFPPNSIMKMQVLTVYM